MFSVCVIIPTKNRPRDLELAVRSVFAQTFTSISLVIVDQSLDDDSRLCVSAALAEACQQRGSLWSLNYVQDPTISGLAAARNRAMLVASGDIWLFLDDDVRLEPDFVERLVEVYRDVPAIGGVSGIITNYTRSPLAFRIWSGLFMRGPFHDERQPIYWNAERLRNSPPLRVHRFGGGLMSFQADVIRGKYFDENLLGVSDGEDVDFCSRLDPSTILLLTPRARLEHHHSPVGRLADHWLRRHARANIFLYYKHWNRGWWSKINYSWLWVGYSIVVIIASSRKLSLDSWRALRLGTREASNALAGE